MSEDLSPALQAFIAEAPAARAPHVPFLTSAIGGLPAGSRILDIGAGDAPYRELFSDHDYQTSDWSGTFYEPEHPTDVVAPAHDLPLADDSLDAVVCTQVLEHVPEPSDALREFLRVIRPGGRLIISTPMTWYLHETPHDYYRYTSYGLHHLLDKAGFTEIAVEPMNDSVSTVGALLRHLRWILGTADDGFDERRAAAGDLLAQAAVMVESVAWLDTQWLLPISFAATARVPTGEPG